MGHEFRHDDIPAGVSVQTRPLERYNRALRWGGGARRFQRTLSIPVGVTGEQHSLLRYAAGWANWAALGMVKFVKETSEAAGEWKPLDRKVVGAALQKVTDAVVKAGFGEATTVHHAAVRAAVYAASSAGGFLKMGRPPAVKFREIAPGFCVGLPVRLHAGAVYGRPVAVQDDLLLLGDVGLVRIHALPGLPDGRCIGEAAYAEFTFWEQMWQVRFTFVTEVALVDRPSPRLRKAVAGGTGVLGMRHAAGPPLASARLSGALPRMPLGHWTDGMGKRAIELQTAFHTSHVASCLSRRVPCLPIEEYNREFPLEDPTA